VKILNLNPLHKINSHAGEKIYTTVFITFTLFHLQRLEKTQWLNWSVAMGLIYQTSFVCFISRLPRNEKPLFRAGSRTTSIRCGYEFRWVKLVFINISV